MTLTDITASLGASLLSSSLGQAERTRTSVSTDAVTQALDRAGERIESQRSSTEVRLSAFGQVRSAVAQLQDSSQALTATENTDTPEETRAAAEAFVSAFNNAQDTGNTDGALSGDGRASIAASELSRTLNNASSEALRSIGINRSQDGTLNVDRQRFEQALQNDPQGVSSALAEVGRQVEQASSRQLEGNSNLNRAVENLSRQAQALEAQQATQQQLADNLQQATEQAATRFNFVAASGIRAYEQIFAL